MVCCWILFSLSPHASWRPALLYLSGPELLYKVLINLVYFMIISHLVQYKTLLATCAQDWHMGEICHQLLQCATVGNNLLTIN